MTSTGAMPVVLVEPFHSGSHAAWADGWAAHSTHDVAMLTLPGQFWRWRLRGGAVTLAEQIERHVAEHGRPRAIVVSDLVDLAALLGLARRALDGVAVVSYLHENQVAFPRADAGDDDPAWRTWLSLVAADVVVCNSDHHRRVLVAALPGLLDRAPDAPHHHLFDAIVDKMVVVPVGVDVTELAALPPVENPRPVVLWNHRWDVDRAPDRFVNACRRLADRGVDFDVILAGPDGWAGAPRRARAAERLGDRVRWQGEADEVTYRRLLAEADVVVSVSDHEFFGISVVEAIAAGCVPVLPNRLSYPDLVPRQYHDAVLYDNDRFTSKLAEVLEDLPAARARVAGLGEAMERYDWSVVAPQLDELVAQAAGGSFERGVAANR